MECFIPSFCFPRSNRLRKRQEFLHVQQGSQAFVGKTIIIQWRDAPQSDKPHMRLGITVTKKFGIACKRNRFKRLVREAFRLCAVDSSFAVDLNVKPKMHVDSFQFVAIHNDFLAFLRYLSRIKS